MLPHHASVAFTRAFAHHGDAKDPIAAAAGTFMLGTKGEVTRPQSIGPRGDGPGDQAMSTLLGCLAEVRKSGDVARLAEAIPYARWMRIARRTARASF